MFRRVYLDNSATTRVADEVFEAMLPFLRDFYGNPSSIHHFGQEARTAVDKARHQVAAMLNARPNDVLFTSGGTESNNLAIRGFAQTNAKYGNHIITSAIEHPAVLNVCEDLAEQGFEITHLPVYANGIVRMDDLNAAIRDDTILITIMAANNEIGTLQPVEAIGRLVRELRKSGSRVRFHTDAVQAVGKITTDVEAIGCDMLSLSGHKINAPKGIGALYVRRGTRLHAQNVGGRQERGLRGGTEAVPGIVGLGTAADIAAREMPQVAERTRRLRDRIEQSIAEQVSDITFNGDRIDRLPNIANISFRGVEGEGLLINLDMAGVAVSTGSACSSGSLEPSPVIRALDADDETARSAIRFSLGRYNSDDDIDRLLEILPQAVENLRRLAPPK
ncbi:MAG: cysteine desulfurase [Acidobacteria bacterium]|nr:cysteine desulfurase [Acidobacteriota bacterium]